MVRTQVFAGVGLVSAGLFLPLSFGLEAATRPMGTDGDNPTESLLYLQEHGTAYALSGCCLLLAALGLMRAATAVSWRTPFQTVVGSVAAGLWSFTGALRISSPGPIDHIREYDQEWERRHTLSFRWPGRRALCSEGWCQPVLDRHRLSARLALPSPSAPTLRARHGGAPLPDRLRPGSGVRGHRRRIVDPRRRLARAGATSLVPVERGLGDRHWGSVAARHEAGVHCVVARTPL